MVMNGGKGKRKLNAYQLFVKKYMNSMPAAEKSRLSQPQIMKNAAAAYRAQNGNKSAKKTSKKRRKSRKKTKKTGRRRRR